MDYRIGVDLGGTNIVVGLLNKEHQLIRKIKRPTEAKLGSDHVLSRIAEMALAVMEEEQIERKKVIALGAGIPGLIDPVRGICNFAGNLGWEKLPVAQLLREKLGLPVYIDNDVRVYAYGEAVAGAGKGYDVMFGLTLGTGVASALIQHGKLFYGSRNLAGEFGHIRFEDEHAVCGCGMRGCLETIASANGIARLAREQLTLGRQSRLMNMVSEINEVTSAHIAEAYDQGDPLSIEVMGYAGQKLGKALSYIVTVLNPDVIVVGGGAAQAGERIFAPMRAELTRLVLPMYMEKLAIKQAELLDDAGVIGSASLAAARATSGAE